MREILAASSAALPLLVGLLLAAAPLAPSAQDFLILTTYYFLIAASWNLLAGFAGQYSFAQAGLAAFGAYVAGGVSLVTGYPIWVGLIAAPLACLVVGAALGLIALRVRGVQLSLITFAIANAFGVFLSAASDLTGGSMGMEAPRLFDGQGRAPFLLVAGLATTVVLFLQDRLLDSGFGLQMQAVRDEEPVARGLGVNVYRVKVASFAISALIAGFAGAFYASYVGVLAPTMVSVSEMGSIVAMAVVGGLGRRYGALIGAFVLQGLTFAVRDFGAQYTLLVTSGLSLLAILFFRRGILQAAEALWRRLGSKKPTRWAEPGPAPKQPG